jgi:hypothetical protein
MGANATTSVPVYTAGEVLTAADLNITNSGIPVFATTTTRDAAFGGSGEKTLAEGQYAYIEATNTTQYYDGASWLSVGGGSFVLVSSGSVSAASAITLDSIFTSTYRNYKVFINGTCSADDSDITFKFRASGSTNSANSYSRKIISAGASTVTTSAATGQTSFTSFMATGQTQVTNETTIFAPQVAIATGVQYMSGAVSTNSYEYLGSGVFTNTTQFDGFVITPVSGTITAQYRIYGLAD